MLVGHWPDLGLKHGARAEPLLTRPTWYAKGTVQSDLKMRIWDKRITQIESERERMTAIQVKKTEMGNLWSLLYMLYT